MCVCVWGAKQETSNLLFVGERKEEVLKQDP